MQQKIDNQIFLQVSSLTTRQVSWISWMVYHGFCIPFHPVPRNTPISYFKGDFYHGIRFLNNTILHFQNSWKPRQATNFVVHTTPLYPQRRPSNQDFSSNLPYIGSFFSTYFTIFSKTNVVIPSASSVETAFNIPWS
jgi:hypothetical protein